MKNLLILFILAFSCNCMAGNNEPAHVIITAGQSNTDGRVPNDRLPDYIKIRLLRQEPTSIAELPRTVQTGNSVPSGLRVKEEPNPIPGGTMLLPTIGWNNGGKSLSMLSNGQSAELLSSLPMLRTNQFIGRQIPNGWQIIRQPVRKDVLYFCPSSMT